MAIVDIGTLLNGVVTVSLSAIIAIAVARAGKREDAASNADATEVTVRAQFVKDMQLEVTELRKALNIAWDRERALAARYNTDIAHQQQQQHDAFEKFATEYDALERRYRHLTAALLQHIVIIRRLLRRAGGTPPDFVGLDRFEAEGGAVHEEWARAFRDDETS